MNKKILSISLFALLATLTVGCRHDVFVDAQGNRVDVDRNGKDVTVQTKDGTYRSTNDGKKITASTNDGKSMTMETSASVSESELGMPFYPGSEGTNQDSKLDLNGKKTLSSVRITTDSPDKVLEFYKSKMQGIESTHSASQFAMLSAKAGDRLLTMQASQDSGKTTIICANSPTQ